MRAPHDANDPKGLSLRDISFCHEGSGDPLFEGVSWDVPKGQIVALLGPSGVGKSSLLRVIAGLRPPASGSVQLEGETLDEGSFHLPPEKRGVGLVFQDWAVFPHMSVLANVCYGLSHLAKKERLERARSLLTLLEIDALEKRRPAEISGGQLQRVALARTLAPSPRLVLLDEPFSSLDASLRARTRPLLKKVLLTSRATTILVTHDRREAEEMASEIWELRSGEGLVRC